MNDPFADGDVTTFAATPGVLGGTGRYASATGADLTIAGLS